MKLNIKEIGQRVKLLRNQQNLTQEQLAELAGISTHYVYEIEAGLKPCLVLSWRQLPAPCIHPLIIFYLVTTIMTWKLILLPSMMRWLI